MTKAELADTIKFLMPSTQVGGLSDEVIRIREQLERADDSALVLESIEYKDKFANMTRQQRRQHERNLAKEHGR